MTARFVLNDTASVKMFVVPVTNLDHSTGELRRVSIQGSCYDPSCEFDRTGKPSHVDSLVTVMGDSGYR